MKPPALHKILRVLGLLFLAGLCVVPRAWGANVFVVTTNSDSGPGSLRQAVNDANVNGGTIVFSNVTGTITLTSAELIFTGNLSLVGPGSANLAVSGGGHSRVFNVYASSTSSISGLTISGGRGAGTYPPGGGGVYNAGSLMLSNCVVANNVFINVGYSDGYGGGGLCNQGTMTLENGTVANNSARQIDFGRSSPWGGGIYNLGFLTVNNSAVFNNKTDVAQATAPYSVAHGGGIYNLGTLLLTRSSIANNITANAYNSEQGAGNDGGSGGGLYNGSTATLIACTINGNRCGTGGHGGTYTPASPYHGGHGGSGGGIYSSGSLSLTNCTIYGNTSGSGGIGGNYSVLSGTNPSGDGGNAGDGAGICNAGSLMMASCTVSRGITSEPGQPGYSPYPYPTQWGSYGRLARGSGIWNESGTAQVANSLIASNADVGGVFTSQGHNLIGNTNGSQGFPGTNDLINIDPKLGPLTNNGGPTLTCALLPGSPAIDAGDESLIGTDQRGFARPSGAHVDIGAFEVQVPFGPLYLTGPQRLTNGGLRFSFTNTPGANFTVLATTNVAQPSTNWTVLGSAVESAPGWFELTEPTPTNAAQRFFQIRWP